MSPVNYRLKLPTQWSIHDVFHIDLLTPYHKMALHGPNYSRLPPDLVKNQEEYEVEKILDSRRFGRRRKLQYLVKWKGYPNLDNEWVNKKEVHAYEAIRKFKNQNPASEAHISQGHSSKSLTSPSSLTSTLLTHKLFSLMTDVNPYYLRSPKHIFGAELKSGLITEQEAQELCAKKYIRPHITDKNTLAAPLTQQELDRIQLQFPDLVQKPMALHALSPMVRRLSDPDGMGATPTHQATVHKIDTAVWGPKDSSAGEILLPVPFRDPNQHPKRYQEDMLRVEGRAVHKSRCQEKWAARSPGSTALASSLATHGPWSQTMSINTKDIYPAEHPFI